MDIYPRCKKDWNQIYINSEGVVFPCCWMANLPAQRDYYSLHGTNLEELNIHHRNLEEIVNSDQYLQIEKSWKTENPYTFCVSNCAQKNREESSRQGNDLVRKIDLKKLKD